MIARIDDFQPGQHVTLSKTFTEEDVRRFIEITGDVNPRTSTRRLRRARSSAAGCCTAC